MHINNDLLKLTLNNYISKCICNYGEYNSNHNYFYKIDNIVIFNASIKLNKKINSKSRVYDFINIPKELTPKGNVVFSGTSAGNTALITSYVRASDSNIVLETPIDLDSGAEVNIWGVYCLV